MQHSVSGMPVVADGKLLNGRLIHQKPKPDRVYELTTQEMCKPEVSCSKDMVRAKYRPKLDSKHQVSGEVCIYMSQTCF